jgi:hypothetical protein
MFTNIKKAQILSELLRTTRCVRRGDVQLLMDHPVYI